MIVCALPVAAQTFSSGSDGSDGDFVLPAPPSGQSSTVTFDPNDKTLFPNGVDKGQNNVFNFGKITIPANVHVILRADKLGGPVYFLAQGAVTIQGWLDLDGNPGAGGGYIAQTYAVPGPGGFYGGAGGNNATIPPAPGFGPLPGAAGNPAQNGIGSCTNYWGGGGGYTGNTFLVPLIGGSGGGGYFATAPQIGPGGGAGGGAILIASSGTITIASGGQITARGGNIQNYNAGAGAGAGGSIRLVANTITGNGNLYIGGPGEACGTSAGAGGRIRLEAFQQSFTGNIDGTLTSSSPFATFVPTATSPKVKVLSVNGVAVAANPNGYFTVPDVTINSSTAVPVIIEADNIPKGTVITMQVFSENGPTQPITFPALAGAGPNFQVSANVAFPTGFSRGFIQASFTQ
jgi:hypothetical protein